jgi:AcrR family transcriptional regulator
MRADARRNYEALVEAAREVFVELGSDAPLDEIARRAGVGAGTLYRHFPTRADLLAGVYAADLDALAAEGRRLLDTQNPAAALDGFMTAYLRMGMRNGAIKRAVHAMLSDTEPVPALLTSCRGTVHGIAAEVVEHAQKAGVARPDLEPATLMRMIYGIALASEDNPSMAPAMLEVLRAGVLLTGDRYAAETSA